MSFTIRGATGVIVQPHQIMRLPRKKMILMIDPCHIWNVIYNARSNRCHPPTSPNTAPATKNFMIDPCHVWNIIYNARSNRCHWPTSPNTAPAPKTDSHDWSLSHVKRHLQCAEQQVSSSNLTKYCACHEKNLMIDPCHIWNIIYNARSNRCHWPTSPNTAPAPKTDSHDWSLSHMKRHLQGAEQQVSLSNLTAYSGCHEKWPSKCERDLLKTDETPFTIPGRSDHDPTMIRDRSDHEPVRPQLASQPRLLFARATHFV